MTNPDSAQSLPNKLTLLTIGFCKDLEGEAKLKAAGIERIWRLGNGAESLADAIYDFRGRPGTLAVVDDLRIFSPNDSNYEIAAVCARLTRIEIDLVDITQPELIMPELQERARKALHASRPMPNHRTARRRGRQGGLAKAAAAEAARTVRIAPDIAQRLWSLKEITQKAKLWVLGKGFTLSSCQRHFT